MMFGSTEGIVFDNASRIVSLRVGFGHSVHYSDETFNVLRCRVLDTSVTFLGMACNNDFVFIRGGLFGSWTYIRIVQIFLMIVCG